jgi:hypothetical protein
MNHVEPSFFARRCERGCPHNERLRRPWRTVGCSTRFAKV